MAELTVSIIPTDPYFVPDRKAATRAKASLRRYYEWADSPPKAEFTAKPQFFCGDDNCERFVCSACSKVVGVRIFEKVTGDPQAWRSFIDSALRAPDAMEHVVEVPCCKTLVKLSDLVFRDGSGNASAAIGSFRLSVVGAYDSILSEERLLRLQKTLGCELRQMIGIWA